MADSAPPLLRPNAPAVGGGAPARESIAEGLLKTVSWLVPFAVVLSRVSVGPSFDGDLGNLRALGLVSVGPGGGLSTALAQVVRWLPLGSLTFRTAIVSTLLLAITSRLLFGIALTFLRSVEREKSVWLAPALATIAATTATLTPIFEVEATIGGGAIVAIACLFGAVHLSQRLFERRSEHISRDAVWVAALLACTLSEDVPCGVLALLYMACATYIASKRPAPFTVPDRAIRFAIGVFFLTLGVLIAPAIVRAMTPRTLVDFGPIASARLAGLVDPPPNKGALVVLVRDVGWIPLAMATLGAFVSLVTRRARRELAPLFLFALLDGLFAVFMPARLLKMFSFASWDLAALGALSIALVTGLHAIVNRLDRIALTLRRPISVLLVAFHVMLVALIAEQAGDRADRSEHAGAGRWTDAALNDLPPSSTVVARSPILELRLFTAQLVEGVRKDVVVVPLSWLSRGSVASDAAARERELEPLLRTVALTGTTDEFGLSSLADKRHLFVEPDPRWDARIASHLTPEVAWMAYAPEPLSSSDRDEALARAENGLSRWVATAAQGSPTDPENERAVAMTVSNDLSMLVRAKSNDAVVKVERIAVRSGGEHLLDGLNPDVTSAMKLAEKAPAIAPTTRPRVVTPPPPAVARRPEKAHKPKKPKAAHPKHAPAPAPE